MRYLVLLALVTPCVASCSSKEKEKQIGELKAKLKELHKREEAMTEELSKTKVELTRVQNEFKIYKKKPCDVTLGEANLTVEKKDGMTTPPPAMRPVMRVGMLPAMAMVAPQPTGPQYDLSAVPRKIRSARYRFKRCYEKAVKKNPSLASSRRVTLKFSILASGRVVSTRVVPPVGFGFESCVRPVVSGWRFKNPSGRVQRFRVPMRLRAQ